MSAKSFLVLMISQLLFSAKCFCQDAERDSLFALLTHTKADTLEVNLLNEISKSYLNSSAENALKYAQQAKEIAEKAGYRYGLAYALKYIGISYYMQSDYIETLANWNLSLKEFEAINDKTGIANILSNLGAVYFDRGDDAKALDYHLKSLQYAKEIHDTLRIATVLINIGAVYLNKPATYDKALDYYLQALPLSEHLGDDDAIGTTTVNLGEIYLARGDDTTALNYFKRSLKAFKNSKNLPYTLNNIAKVFEKRGDYNTALRYHNQALETAKNLNGKLDMAQSYLGLAAAYSLKSDIDNAINNYKLAQTIAKNIGAYIELKSSYTGLSSIYATAGDYANAYTYQRLLTDINDTLYNYETEKKIAMLQFNSEIEKKQAEIDQLTNDSTLKEMDLKKQATVRNYLIAMLLLVMIIGFVLFRNYRIKAKANKLLDHRQKELEQTLNELKAMQTQLIQSEKMASLGELTAGIAHEIQNPLNFVNNFSEVNKELIDEATQEIDKGNTIQVKNILNDIKDNEEKINHHGKRADAIVKGMLQHSRASTGKKEQTDINALVDEYLRLSYYGLRAKDKNFNAELQTEFDESIGKINVVPQDTGRVLLNLYNNAFYAVNEKKKTAGENYKPCVSVQTKKLTNKIEIKVADNGNGIPQKVIDKVFQPFFTTKPTGEGTGLGLSLSYDIIKAHGGEIKMQSKEGKGSEFIIEIPFIKTFQV
jgi:two-component system NtrC family sensor kinase